MIPFRVLIAMAVALGLKMVAHSVIGMDLLYAEIDTISTFLQVLGSFYGVVLAFIIFVVWDQFNRVQVGIFHEAAALEDLGHAIHLISNRNNANRINTLILDYISITVSQEPPFLARGNPCSAATQAFLGLVDAVREVDVATPKDKAVYDEICQTLGRVNDARDARLGVSAARIPSTLWNLVVFSSLALIGGFLFLAGRLLFLAYLMIATITGCVTLLLTVIEDMDNPFDGVWVVSYTPFSTVADRLKCPSSSAIGVD